MDSSRAGLLDSIQKAGGIGSLKKVDKSEIRDRSAVNAAGGSGTGPHGSGLPPSGVSHGGQAPMADALAAALQKRKEKVSKSGKFFQGLRCGAVAGANVLQMMRTMMMTGETVLRWVYGLGRRDGSSLLQTLTEELLRLYWRMLHGMKVNRVS